MDRTACLRRILRTQTCTELPKVPIFNNVASLSPPAFPCCTVRLFLHLPGVAERLSPVTVPHIRADPLRAVAGYGNQLKTEVFLPGRRDGYRRRLHCLHGSIAARGNEEGSQRRIRVNPFRKEGIAAGVCGKGQLVFVDVNDTVIDIHGYHKQSTGYRNSQMGRRSLRPDERVHQKAP